MKKQSKQLIILLLALVLLIAGFFGLKQYNKAQEHKSTEDARIMVLDIAEEDIIKFSYDYEGVTYAFEKEGDTWVYSEDTSVSLDQDRILPMIKKFAPLYAEDVITEVKDMSQYGLDEPTKRIAFETAKDSFVIEIGDLNNVASVYYMRIPSENTVYTVMPPVKTIFDRTLDDMIPTAE